MEKPPVFMGIADKKFTKRQVEWLWQLDAKVQHNGKRLAKWVPSLQKNNKHFDAIMIKYDREYRNLGNADRPLDMLTRKERNKLLAMNLKQIALLQKQMKPLRSAYKYATRMTDAKEKITLQFDQTRKSMNKMLRQCGELLPLWVGIPGEYPPKRCCRIPSKDKPKRGELSSVYVNEMWILAEVMTVEEQTNTVVVRDIDEDGGMFRVYTEQVILLPKYRLDPLRYPYAIFPVDAVVYGLYPQTTCFYKGIVSNPPLKDTDDYFITFEDEDYDGLFAPEVRVPQRFVVPFKKVPKKVMCEAVKVLEDNDVVETFKINDIIDQEDCIGSSKGTKRRLPEALREKTPETIELSSSEDTDVVMVSAEERQTITNPDAAQLMDSNVVVKAKSNAAKKYDENMEMDLETFDVAKSRTSCSSMLGFEANTEDVFETGSKVSSKENASKTLSVQEMDVQSDESSGVGVVIDSDSEMDVDSVRDTVSPREVVVDSQADANVNVYDVFETSFGTTSSANTDFVAASLAVNSKAKSHVNTDSEVQLKASSVTSEEASDVINENNPDVIILSDSEDASLVREAESSARNSVFADTGAESQSDVNTVVVSETSSRTDSYTVTAFSETEVVIGARPDVITLESSTEVESGATLTPERDLSMEAELAMDSNSFTKSFSKTRPMQVFIHSDLPEDSTASDTDYRLPSSEEFSSDESSSDFQSIASTLTLSPSPNRQSIEPLFISSHGEHECEESSQNIFSPVVQHIGVSFVTTSNTREPSSLEQATLSLQDGAQSDIQFLDEVPAQRCSGVLSADVQNAKNCDNFGYLFDDRIIDDPLIINRDQQDQIDQAIRLTASNLSLLPEQVIQGIENLDVEHRFAPTLATADTDVAIDLEYDSDETDDNGDKQLVEDDNGSVEAVEDAYKDDEENSDNHVHEAGDIAIETLTDNDKQHSDHGFSVDLASQGRTENANDSISEDQKTMSDDINGNSVSDEIEAIDKKKPVIKDYYTDCSESSTDVQSNSDSDNLSEVSYDSNVVELSNGSEGNEEKDYLSVSTQPDNELDEDYAASEQEIDSLSDTTAINYENSQEESDARISILGESELLFNDGEVNSKRSAPVKNVHSLELTRDNCAPEDDVRSCASVRFKTPTRQIQCRSPELTEKPPAKVQKILTDQIPVIPLMSPHRLDAQASLRQKETSLFQSASKTQVTSTENNQSNRSFILEQPPPMPLSFTPGAISYVVPPPPPPPPLETYNPEDRNSVPMDVDTPSPI